MAKKSAKGRKAKKRGGKKTSPKTSPETETSERREPGEPLETSGDVLETSGDVLETNHEARQDAGNFESVPNKNATEDVTAETATKRFETAASPETSPETEENPTEESPTEFEPPVPEHVKSPVIESAGKHRPAPLESREPSAQLPPLAVSTPLWESYENSGPASETSPLLSPGGDLESGAPAQKRSLGPRILLLVAVASVVILLIHTGMNASITATQAVSANAEKVSVRSVRDSGVSMQVALSIATHYGQVSNLLLRYLLSATGVLGTVFVSLDRCDVFIAVENGEPQHVISASFPEFPFSLANNRVSEVEIKSDVEFREKGLAFLANYLGNTLDYEVSVAMDAVVRKKWMKYGRKNQVFRQQVKLNVSELVLPELRDLSVFLSDDALQISVSASSAKKFPVNYTFQAMKWDLLVRDCEKNLRRLGEFNLSALLITPDSFPSTHIDLLVTEVLPQLLEVCSDGVSPFNKFMGSLVNERMVRAYVSAQEDQELPKWLMDLLRIPHKVSIPIPIDDDLFLPFFPDKNSFFEDLDVVVATKDGKLSASVSTQANVAIMLPLKSSSFHAKASEINYTVDLYDKFESVAISEGSGGKLAFSVDEPYTTAVVTFPDTEVAVKSPRKMGKLVSGFLNGDFHFPFWSLLVSLADLTLKLVTTRLKDLVLKSGLSDFGLTTLGLGTFESFGKLIVDRFLKNMDIQVDNVVVVSTGRDHIGVLVDLELTNALNLSLAIAEDVILDLSYNGTVIGTAEFAQLVLESLKRQQVSTSLRLFYDSDPQRVLVEEFLSHVILGSNATYLSVAGSSGDTPLAEMLQEVALGVRVPEIGYGNLQTNTDLHIGTQSSPFLLGATIHLWTSEIEVTLLNPLSNMEIDARIESCIASYDGHMLAHIEHSEVVVVPPGVYTTPRIPIEISTGIGADILRRALNGDLAVDVVAQISVLVGDFPAEVVYRGSGLTAQIKI